MTSTGLEPVILSNDVTTLPTEPQEHWEVTRIFPNDQEQHGTTSELLRSGSPKSPAVHVALCSAPCGCFLCHWQNNQSLVG